MSYRSYDDRSDRYSSSNIRKKSKKRRRYSSSSEESSDSEDSYKLYDFTRVKSKLNKIFFRDEDFVKLGTKEYDEFWSFLSKYQSMERRKLEQQGNRNNER